MTSLKSTEKERLSGRLSLTSLRTLKLVVLTTFPFKWWCQMSVMASPITVNSSVCQQIIRTNNNQSSALRAFREGNTLVTGGFPLQRISYTINVSVLWSHHASLPGSLLFSLGFQTCLPNSVTTCLPNSAETCHDAKFVGTWNSAGCHWGNHHWQ